MLLEVNKNLCVEVRERNIYFLFNRWLNSNSRLQKLKLLVKDCWGSTNWDAAKLIELVSEDKVGKLARSTV